MSAVASQVISLKIVNSNLCSRHRSKKTSKLHVTGLCGDRWITRTKGQKCRKCFHLMTSSCRWLVQALNTEFTSLQTLQGFIGSSVELSRPVVVELHDFFCPFAPSWFAHGQNLSSVVSMVSKLVEQISQKPPLTARSMGPTWDPSGADRTQVGPKLAPWTLLSGTGWIFSVEKFMVLSETVVVQCHGH